jgi:DNA polymerase III epsilon subunit-like protein
MEYFNSTNPAPLHLMTKTQGKEQGLTLKKNAQPVGYRVNQWSKEEYYLYPPEAFQPKRAPTEKQLAALAAGRELLGSSACNTEGCTNRCYDDWQTGRRSRYCDDCQGRKRKSNAADTARAWLDADPVILDSETTGLDDNAEIVELALIDAQGNTLIDTLIKPIDPIPQEVIDIHGITNEMVADAPTFAEVIPDLLRHAEGRPIVVYNSEYDNRLIKQSAVKAGMPSEELWHLIDSQSNHCLMKLYARYYGTPGRHGGYKWYKLHLAAGHCGIDSTGAHRARADCVMTLGILKALAEA